MARPEFETPYFKAPSMWLKTVVGIVGEGKDWDGSLARAVMSLHDGVRRKTAMRDPLPDTLIPPDIIFATTTSAIPYASAIKECWRTAFPGEKPPRFFTIDVSPKRFYEYHNGATPGLLKRVNEQEKKRLREIGETYGVFENVAVFDEFSIAWATPWRAEDLLRAAGYTNVNVVHDLWSEDEIDFTNRPVIRASDYRKSRKRRYYDPPMLNPDGRQVMPVIRDMRLIGRMMGEQILAHKP